MFTYRPQLVALSLAALVALVIVACAGSAGQDAFSEPSDTSTPGATTGSGSDKGTESELADDEANNDQQPRQVATPEATVAAKSAAPTPAPAPEPPTPGATLAPATPIPSAPPRAVATDAVDRIAFSDGRGSVFTVNPDGTGVATVAKGSLFGAEPNYTFPVWSPDGGSLVFSSFTTEGGTANRLALHRADADGKGAIVTLAVDGASQGGLGPGIPHFSAWSPDGELIVFITTSQYGIGTILLGSNSGESPTGLALGAPLYVSWAPDGTSILVHQGAGLSIIPITLSGSGTPIPVGTGSVSFNVPSWAPDSQSFAHLESFQGTSTVVLTQLNDINNQEIIAEADARVVLRWSPDGKYLAIARSSGAGDGFQTLSLYSPDDSVERTIYTGHITAFWWSPDSSKLAVVEDSHEIDLAYEWSAVDVESGESTALVTQVIAADFLFVLAFFDQYAESHRIWSPDSSRIVVTGSWPDRDGTNTQGISVSFSESSDSQVWVLDAAGVEEPISIGSGTIASWSPR